MSTFYCHFNHNRHRHRCRHRHRHHHRRRRRRRHNQYLMDFSNLLSVASLHVPSMSVVIDIPEIALPDGKILKTLRSNIHAFICVNEVGLSLIQIMA